MSLSVATGPLGRREQGRRAVGPMGAALALCLLMAGCGQKGPLFLPEQAAAPAGQPAAAASAASATSETGR